MTSKLTFPVAAIGVITILSGAGQIVAPRH